MNRARTILILALLACGSCSGTGRRSGDLRNGPWTEYYPSGKPQCAGSYENDVQTGLWTYWFENGNKEMEGRFVDERRDGPWSSWHDNGTLRATGRFEGGFEEGMWRFHDRSGALDHEGTFEFGQPELLWTWFRPDGTVRETGVYHAGVKVGPWTARDAAGQRADTFYPVPAGLEWVEEHFPDSTLERMGFVRDGLPVGRWNSFHPGGKLRLECTFDRGAPNGTARAWRADGSLLACGRLSDGCVLGKWVFSRGGSQEESETGSARPRQAFGGEWSPAESADLPGWTAVETWVAEICSPRQPAPLQPVAAAQPSARAPNPGSSELSGIPARAQPWTEYERRALPALVKLYGSGRSAADDEYESPPTLRKDSSKPAARVASPADLIGQPLPVKRFTTADGGLIDLDAFVGKHNVLVTILRGFGGQVCVYCTAQTKALADFAAQFAALDTQVVVVFPGPASGLRAFLEAYERTFGAGAKPPYELLYDTDLTLTRALHLEDNIAVPSSLLLDRKGIIRWCRLAKDRADRPAAKEILGQIEALPKHER